MMDNPHSETITLPPKSEEEYDIGVSFSSDVLTSKKATFDNLVQPEVSVSYKQGGEEKLAQKKLESRVPEVNSSSWVLEFHLLGSDQRVKGAI